MEEEVREVAAFGGPRPNRMEVGSPRPDRPTQLNVAATLVAVTTFHQFASHGPHLGRLYLILLFSDPFFPLFYNTNYR